MCTMTWSLGLSVVRGHTARACYGNYRRGIGGGTMIASGVVPVIMAAEVPKMEFCSLLPRRYGTGDCRVWLRSDTEHARGDGLERQRGGRNGTERPRIPRPFPGLAQGLQDKSGLVPGLIFFWYAIRLDVFSLWFWRPNYFTAVTAGRGPGYLASA